MFKFSLGPSPLINKCATLIDEVGGMLRQHLFPEKDSFTSTSRHELAVRLDQFLKGEKWQEKINQWSELGVNLLSDERQTHHADCVNILIKRDSGGLPTMIKIFLPSTLQDLNFNCDLTDIEQCQEKLRKYNLTYHRDVALVESEVKHLNQMLPKSNDATRLKLLNEFNLKWNGQLVATYAINHQFKTGLLKITDASGQVIVNNQITNHVYLDPAPPTTATVLHAQRKALPQPEAHVSAPSRNGTDRYDLRITGQKRSYKY
ncbi:MAG: hypothetical protein ACHQAX_10025 [Gammaproteobacteria bacterium]